MLRAVFSKSSERLSKYLGVIPIADIDGDQIHVRPPNARIEARLLSVRLVFARRRPLPGQLSSTITRPETKVCGNADHHEQDSYTPMQQDDSMIWTAAKQRKIQ
jgi:hypothetical protein